MKLIKELLATTGTADVHEGWFSKPKFPTIDRQPVTADDRRMIAAAFDFGHNANLKHANGEYVLPDNVTLNYRKARVNFYKDGDKLMASIGHYDDEDGPGDPSRRPITSSERQIRSKTDLYNLKDLLDGPQQGSRVSHDSMRYKEFKRDTGIGEGWKSSAAGAAIAGAVMTGIANSPKITVDGISYDKAVGGGAADPKNAKEVKTVTIKGEKYKVWSVVGYKGRITYLYTKLDK